MSLKLKALLQLIGLIILAVGIAGLAHYIRNTVPVEKLYTIFQGSLIGVVLYACYNLLLGRLEINEKTKQLDK